MRNTRTALARCISVAIVAASLLGSGCSDPTSTERYPGPPDGQSDFPANAMHRFVVRDSVGHLRSIAADARRAGDGLRRITVSIDGRHVLTLHERWEQRAGTWRRVARSAEALSASARALSWDGRARIDDAPLTPRITLVSADARCDDVEIARLEEGAEGSCTTQALKFVAAGLLADAAVAAAIANPLLAPAAIAAIANVSVAYDEYITCLRNEARME